MKKTMKALALILSILLLVGLMAGCGGGTTSGGASTPGSNPAASTPASTPDDNSPAAVDHNLTVGTMYSHLYMFTAGSGESDNYCRRLVYDQLFYISDITGELTSDILASWEWTDDVTLKMVLKDGILFSDGTKMTGEDVLATLKAYVDNANSELEFFQRIDLAKSNVENELTVNLVYTETYGAALSTLTIPVLSKAFLEAHPDGDDAWWYSPVGSGPYTVGNVEMGVSVEYILREDYWNTDANYQAETITVRYYSDATAEYADYVAGVIDIMIDLNDTQVTELSKVENTKVVIQSADDVCMVAFNEATVPEAVRKAIAHGVDWAAVAEATYGQLCTPATSHLASTFAAYSDHGQVYEYDVDKAKQILADAGITSFTLTLPCFGGSTDPVAGEALQFFLGELGIELVINQMDIPTLIPALIGGEGDISFQSTAANGNAAKEPNTCLSPMMATGFKIMALSDEEFNSYVAGGLTTVDDAERAEFYKKADQWLYDNYQAIPLCERSVAYCYNTAKIANYSIASLQRGSLAFVEFVG